MSTFDACRAAFRDLHSAGCFVIPNPWDVGSARYLQHLGFKALATTSAGFAFTRGLPDGAVSRADMLAHFAEIANAVDLPVNADFASGFADDPEAVAESVTACVQTGVAGLSIEDATGNASQPLYDFSLAVDRIRASRRAIDRSGTGVLLTARAECYLTGHPEPFAEAIRRLQAYAEAGADVLYAPGVSKRDEMKAIVAAVWPKPVNILIFADIGMHVSDLAELGVRRISVGSALARSAWSSFVAAATNIAQKGSFEGLSGLTSLLELNSLFRSRAASGATE